MKISHKSELRLRFKSLTRKYAIFSQIQELRFFRKDYNFKTIVITILTTGNGASGKNFISLDISDFRQKNNCLKVFEMMKKSLHFATANQIV